MGALASRPSVPAPQSQIIFVPASAPASVAQTSSDVDTSTDNSATDTPLSDEALQSEQRSESLLRRNRGRFGTVQTGFRGLLSALNAGQRKTLLGE